jgi:hypothetical protein
MLACVCKELFPQGVLQKIEGMVLRDSQASSPTAALMRQSLEGFKAWMESFPEAARKPLLFYDGRGWREWGTYTPANIQLLKRLQALP